MSKFNYFRSGTCAFLALALTSATFVSIIPAASVSAQVFKGPGDTTYPRRTPNRSRIVIPEGTTIPLKYEKDKILLTKNETVPVTLKVAANVKNRQGMILIPIDSEVVGEIVPVRNEGSRFVAERLIIDSGREEYDIMANSDTVNRIEKIDKGVEVQDVLIGTAAGAGAAAAIAAVVGDRKVSAVEVLGGALGGATLGTLLAGTIKGGRAELISIDPNRDLDITLNSDLALDGRYANRR